MKFGCFGGAGRIEALVGIVVVEDGADGTDGIELAEAAGAEALGAVEGGARETLDIGGDNRRAPARKAAAL